MSQGKLSSRGRVIRVIRGESSQKHAMINVLNVFYAGQGNKNGASTKI